VHAAFYQEDVMALLERVTTLLRANLNDLIDRAEDPAKMLKQLLLDMENQLLQVKTQVAIAVADGHVLEQKRAEHEASVASWRRKAQLALDKEDEALARTALERSVASEQLLAGFTQQMGEQRREIETLREGYLSLQAKLEETRAQGELLLKQQRRARNGSAPMEQLPTARVVAQLKDDILRTEANKVAMRSLATSEQSVEDRFRKLEREERIDTLLDELKSQPRLLKS
jgi:phage shock protein A